MANARIEGQETPKSVHEEDALRNVLAFCEAAGGVRRQNARKFIGNICSSRECPDLAVVCSENRVIGLEHFRVDHHVRHDKNAQSKSARLVSELKSKGKSVFDAGLDDSSIKTMAEIIGKAVSEGLENIFNACLFDLVRSFEKQLSDKEYGHETKLKKYRDNMRSDFGDAARIELGYLIEVHSDFSGLFLNELGEVRRLRSGEMPLFREIYDLLNIASGKVDWILLGFYEPIGRESRDGAILRCSNGLFSKSCRQHGLLKTSYLGLGRSEPSRKRMRASEYSFEIREDSIDLLVGKSFELPDARLLLNNSFQETAAALNLNRKREPFTATLPVQLIYEAIYAASKKHRGAFCSRDIARLLALMPRGELSNRVNNFGFRYGINPE